MAVWGSRGFVRSCLALAIALAVSAAAADRADAVVFRVGIKKFKASIDVKLDLTEHSVWKGAGASGGCVAPYEDFDVTHQVRVNSRPRGRGSKIKNGNATLVLGELYGVSASYGAKGSFRQYATGSQWSLTTANPAGCGPTAPPPAWAVSPTCKKVSDRVRATLVVGDAEDVKTGDGALVLLRTRKAPASPTPGGRGTSIGSSCARTLHEIRAVGKNSSIAISETTTAIWIPVPDLETELMRIGRGSAKARPSFRIPISVNGGCNAMQMRPSVGRDPDFDPTIGLDTPSEALGSFGRATRCTIDGDGEAIVRREGPATSSGGIAL